MRQQVTRRRGPVHRTVRRKVQQEKLIGNKLSELEIEQSYISVFGSGHSIGSIAEEEIEKIKQHSFLITMNYAPVNITGHMNMWSDKHVSVWMDEWQRNKKKNMLFFAREKGLLGKQIAIKDSVDYLFDEKKEKLQGNYTIVWLCQMLERYFPDKKVLVFGLDMKGISSKRAKWYDDHITFDRLKRGHGFKIDKKLQQCAMQLDRHVKNKEQFINCNPDSRYDGFQKQDWKAILK
jgi:hypothetical protein